MNELGPPNAVDPKDPEAAADYIAARRKAVPRGNPRGDIEDLVSHMQRFNARLLRTAVATGAHYHLAPHPAVTAEQLDFVLPFMIRLGFSEAVNDAVMIAIRRDALALSDATVHALYRWAAESAPGLGQAGSRWGPEVVEVLDRVSDIRLAGGDRAAQREGALEVYVRLEADEHRHDRAGNFITHHPQVTLERLGRMWAEYPSREMIGGVLKRTEREPAVIRDVAVSDLVDAHRQLPAVAEALCTVPDAGDFEAAYQVLIERDQTERLARAFERMAPGALARLGRPIVERLLESPVREVRTAAIAAVGTLGSPTSTTSRIR